MNLLNLSCIQILLQTVNAINAKVLFTHLFGEGGGHIGPPLLMLRMLCTLPEDILTSWFMSWRGAGTSRTYVQTPMVLISDGNLEIGAHVRSNICYLICLRNLIRSRAVTNIFFF